MTGRTRSALSRTALTLAALAVAVTAGAARADHDDHDRDRDHGRAPVVVAVPAPPAYRAAPAPAPAYRAAPAWRTARWGGRPMQVLRDDYRRLETARDRFYATWRGNLARRDRFEAWYASRRAELDLRFADLERTHRHGRG
jgi:hypothetical protein